MEVDKSRWLLVVAASLGAFLVQLDALIINVAAPTIRTELNTDASVVQWVVLGYLVPLIGMSLGAGRWVDTVDPRRALNLGCVGFAIASVTAGLAPAIEWLIIARFVQGCFGAIIMASAPVLATVAVRPDSRGRAFGFLMLFGTLGAMVAPVAGGQIVESIGWAWIFFINLPVSAVMIALTAGQRPLGPRLSLPQWQWVREGVTLGGGAIALLLGLTFASGATAVWGFVALAAIPLIMMWSRYPEAVSVRQLVATPGVAGPHITLALWGIGFYAVMFMTTFFMQDTLHVSPAGTGLVLLIPAMSTGVAGVIAGRLADGIGVRPVAIAGAITMVVGAALLLTVNDSWGPWDVAWRLSVISVGFGFFNGQNQVIAMNSTPPHRFGMASGTLSLIRQLGAAVGSAVSAAIWVSTDSGALAMQLAAAAATVLNAGVVVTLLQTTSRSAGTADGSVRI